MSTKRRIERARGVVLVLALLVMLILMVVVTQLVYGALIDRQLAQHQVSILQMEQLALLREAIAFCEGSQDYVSRDVLEDILGYEEEHVDWIEAQQYLIENSGIQNYLQAKMSDD